MERSEIRSLVFQSGVRGGEEMKARPGELYRDKITDQIFEVDRVFGSGFAVIRNDDREVFTDALSLPAFYEKIEPDRKACDLHSISTSS